MAWVIVPAAGSGRRMGGETAKQFLPLAGVPVLVHTLRRLAACSRISNIVVVTNDPEQVQELSRRYGLGKVTAVVRGGRERQDSVWAGLQAVAQGALGWAGGGDPEPHPGLIVAVHDAARPLVPLQVLEGVLAAAQEVPAQVVAVPVKDTIKITSPEGLVVETPPRARLWAAQTPQVFHFDLLWRAHRQAQADGFLGTDESSLLERLNLPVQVFPGSPENLKLTTPEDLKVAEALLAEVERC